MTLAPPARRSNPGEGPPTAANLLASALGYAERGWAVFPCRPRGKEPIIQGGFKSATTDPEQIRQWWEETPKANIGVAVPAGVIVVDIDPKAGGSEALEEIRDSVDGELPATLACRTGSGGGHLWFTTDEELKQGAGILGPGLDTRIHGKGYVLVPPSVHPCGKPYRWKDARFASWSPVPLPEWLASRLRRNGKKKTSTFDLPPAEGTRAYGEAALEAEVQAVTGAPEGMRNDRLNKAAYALGQLVAGGELDAGMTEAGLLKAARAAGLSDREAARTIGSGLQAGAETPRSAPQHPPSHLDRIPPRSEAAEQEPSETVTEGSDAEQTLGLVIRTMSNVPREDIRPRFGGRLLYGKLGALGGNAGVGKSYLSAVIAAAESQGWKLPGDDHAPPPADVLIASYEDDAGDTIGPRLDALGADSKRIHVIEGVRDSEDRMRPFGASDVSHLETALDSLRDVRLVIVDPVSAFVGSGIDEHRGNEVRGALEGLRRLAAERRVAVLIVMHTRKSSADNALQRLAGSGAYGQLIRTAMFAAHDPDDPSRCAVAHIKHNVTGKAPTLGYKVAEEGFFWLGERTDLDGEWLAGHVDDERSAVDEAGSWLLAYLAEGERPSSEGLEAAAKAGHSERTLRRALRQERIVSKRKTDPNTGRVTGHVWRLPDCQGPGGQPLEGNLGSLDPTRANAPPDCPDGQTANLSLGDEEMAS
jgi:hypothetical protein